MAIYHHLNFCLKSVALDLTICRGTTEGGGRIVNEDYNLIFAITIPQSASLTAPVLPPSLAREGDREAQGEKQPLSQTFGLPAPLTQGSL